MGRTWEGLEVVCLGGAEGEKGGESDVILFQL